MRERKADWAPPDLFTRKIEKTAYGMFSSNHCSAKTSLHNSWVVRKDGEEPGPGKWLEERWEVLPPRQAAIGVKPEEEMKRICQAELEVWRRRPSLKRAISLQKPLTETRTRIREVLPLRPEKWMVSSHIESEGASGAQIPQLFDRGKDPDADAPRGEIRDAS